MSDLSDYRKILKKYKFRDEVGHPLENCVDYQKLLQAANKTISDLPDFETAKINVEIGSASAIERFIYEHEPAGNESSLKFRRELLAAINDK